MLDRWVAAAVLCTGILAACTPSQLFPDARTDNNRPRFPDAEVTDGGAGEDGGGEVPTWNTDVQPIIAARCQQCHGDPLIGGAPFPLLTYQDTQNMYMTRVIHESMALRVVINGTGQMPPTGQTELTQEEDDIIVRWSQGGAPEGERELTWFQDIQPIVANRCQQCHGSPQAGGAPMPLITYEDTQRMSDGIIPQPYHEAMAFRVTRTGATRMPPNGQPDLDDGERAAIVRWSNAGAPRGEGESPDAGPGDGGGRVIPWINGNRSPSPGPGRRYIDTFVHAPNNMNQPGAIPEGDTSYFCYAFTVPTSTQGQEYAVEFEPIFDNARYVHHTFVFHHRAGQGPDWAEFFDCHDNGLLSINDGVQQRPEPIMSGWFPGRGIDRTPDGVGIAVNPGDQLVLQIHYDSIPAGGINDWSGVRVLLSNQPDLINSGEVWSGANWGVDRTDDGSGRVTIVGTGQPLNQDVTVYRAVPHMHELGLSLRFEIERAGTGEWQTLVYVPAWDFHNQPVYDIPPNEQLFRTGDRVRTTCVYDATQRPINSGVGSQEEMCFTMMNHFPLVYRQDQWVEFLP